MLSSLLRAGVLGALAALLLAPGLVSGPSLDPAVFVHVASELLDGQRLYADTWDHKPPGIYLIFAAAQALLPVLDQWLATWLLAMAVTAGAALLVDVAARRLGVRPLPAFAAALLCVVAMGQYLMALGGGLTEPVAAVLLAGALVIVLQGTPGTDRRTAAGPAATGLLLGLAVLVAIPVAPGALAISGLAVARQGPRTALPLAAGAIAPLVAALTWLAATGALPAAVDAVVGYSAAYRLTNEALGWTLSRPVITWTTLALLVLIGPALLGAVAARRMSGDRQGVIVAALAWIGLSVLLVVSQGRFFAHYAIPLAVPLAVLAALGLERVTILHARLPTPVRIMAIYLPAALVVVISTAAGAAGGRMEWLPVARDHLRSQRVAAAVYEMTDPGDSIWVWGNEPQVYLEADRRSATAYSYLYPLVTPGYTTPAMVEDVAASLAADPPAVIIDAGSRAPGVVGFQHLLIPRPLTSDGRDLDVLDPLRQVVRDGYVQAGVVDGWVLYARSAE